MDIWALETEMKTEMDLLLLSLFRPTTSRQPGNPDQDSHQSFAICFFAVDSQKRRILFEIWDEFRRIPIGPSVDNWRCRYFSIADLADRKGPLSVCLVALCGCCCWQIVGTGQFALKWDPSKRSEIVVTDLKFYNMRPLFLLLPWCLFELPVECCNVYADYCDLAELQLQVVRISFFNQSTHFVNTNRFL